MLKNRSFPPKELEIRVVDGFFKDPLAVRKEALLLPFGTIQTFEGKFYERVVSYDQPEVQKKLELIFGPVLMLGQGFRINSEGSSVVGARHVDTGWGTHALVCYLSTGGGGTTFWDSTDEYGASLLYLCREQFNRCVMYRSDIPHSRWPMEGYGTTMEDSRLVFVAFFSVLGEL